MSEETTYICDKCGAKFDKKEGNLFQLDVQIYKCGQYPRPVTLTKWGDELCTDCVEKLGIKLVKHPAKQTEISSEQPEDTSEERLLNVLREFIQEEAERVVEYS